MATQGDLFDVPASKKPAPLPLAAPAAQAEAAPQPEGPPVLTLVDASGFIFRAYHALPGLTTSKGQPTHAVLGFTRMVLKLLRERPTSHFALCFDKDSRVERLKIDPNYKANREAPPPDLVSQFGLIRQVADVLNLPILEYAGWEADDVIGTLVARAKREGFRAQVVTSDKDFYQLLDSHVTLYDPMKDKELTAADCKERYGVEPSKMRDYLALVGDAIDNVPKVPGIGPKTAVELIEKFGGVEALIPRIAEVTKPKVKESLLANTEQLKRAYELVSFKTDLVIDAPLEALKRRELKRTEARTLFTELEFYRLLQEMPSAPPTPLTQKVQLVDSEAALEELVKEMAGATKVALAPAFFGPPHSAPLLGLGVRNEPGTGWYIETRAVGSKLAETLGPALKRDGLALIAHDAKAALHVLSGAGIELPKVATDVELVSYLINPSRKEHALPDMARERLRLELPPEPPEVGAVPGEAERFYGAAAEAICRLEPEVWTEADGVGLGALARELEDPLIPILFQMERAGIKIDLEALKQISNQVDGQLGELLANCYKHAGREFNVGSPLQLSQVLYEELKLPVLKRNKTGPSTDHEVLEKLAESHPLPQAIIDYRNVAKLKSTYLDTLPGMAGSDGRIRTTFHQAAVATGRLSSTDPNLQNIPIRTELGKQIRRAFVAQDGWKLVSADYSQIELRILAHICGDEGLVSAFRDRADVHKRTAAEVFGVEEALVTEAQRRAAKMVNYGIAYGLSPHGLSTRLNIPVDEARGIIERYFQRYSGIQRYLDSTIEMAKKRGYVESLFGRRRYMPDIVSRNRQIAMAAERAAINMPIQGTAADLMKRAMLALDKELRERKVKSRMLLQVHDELLFEAPEAEAEQIAQLAREKMEGAATGWNVPLEVEVGIGHSWADAH